MQQVLPIVKDYEAALALMSTKLLTVRYSTSTLRVYTQMFRGF